MKKQVLCLIMVLCMTISIMPTWALGEEPAESVAEQTGDLESESAEMPVEEAVEEPVLDSIEVEQPIVEPTVGGDPLDVPETPETEEYVSEDPLAEAATENTAIEEPASVEAVSEERIENPQNENSSEEEADGNPVVGAITVEEPVGQMVPEEELQEENTDESAAVETAKLLPAFPTAESEEIKLLDAEEAAAAANARMDGEAVALVVESIRLSAASVKAGESLTVEVGSNANIVRISFRNTTADKTVDSGIMTRSNNGVFTGSISIDNDQTPGIYTVDTVTLIGEAGSLTGQTGTLLEQAGALLEQLPTTTRFYGTGNENYATQTNKLDKALAGTSFEVKANDEKPPAEDTPKDTAAPTVTGISLSNSSVTVPASITVTVKTSEDISLGSNITFRNSNANRTLIGILTKTETGTAAARIELDSNTGEGKYIVDTVYVLDASGNAGNYVGAGNANYESVENRLSDSLASTAITVIQPSDVPTISAASKTTNGIKLSWTGRGSTYSILRKAAGESKYSTIAKNLTDTTYTDKSVISGTKYTYKIRAYDGNGKNIGTSKAKSVTFLAAPKLSSVSVTSAAIKIKWKKVTGAEAYRVMRKTGNGKWKTLASTTVLSYTDSTVSVGATYSYTVRCANADGSKATSAYNTSGKTLTYLASPVLRSVTNAKTGVKITWAQVENAELYRVFRKVDGGKWTALKDTASLTYTDKTAESGTKYRYAVRCVSADGKNYTSSLSASKSRVFVEATVLYEPTVEEGSVSLKWAKVVGAEKYRVFRKTTDGNWKKLKDTTGSKFVDQTAKAGTVYSYAVRCINADGSRYTSAMSTAKTVTVK